MKKIKLNEETTKKFKEALKEFMVNPKKGNAMLDQIRDEQNRPCCQNCKHLVKDTCVLYGNGYRCLNCVDNDFKDFEAK